MQRILRVLCLAVIAVALGGLAACGSSGNSSSSSSSEDVNTLLQKTFSGGKNVKSGNVDLALKMNIKSGSQLNGPVSINLSGPFESQGKGKLPKLNLALDFSGAGQSLKAGVEHTGTKAFINFNGQDYAVDDATLQQFTQGFEQGQAQNGNKQAPSLSTLGIDPRRWLTNPKIEGDAKVGDTDVVRISGGVDVGKLIDDINTALGKAGSLGLPQGGKLPTKITPAQKQQAVQALKNVKVEIDTGKADSILRRLAISFSAADKSGSGDVNLDFKLLDVNKPQSFPEPSGAKPLSELMSQLQGLLPGLSGLGSSGASGSGSSSSSGSGSAKAQADKLKKYSDCITAAGSNVTAAQKCASLLAP